MIYVTVKVDLLGLLNLSLGSTPINKLSQPLITLIIFNFLHFFFFFRGVLLSLINTTSVSKLSLSQEKPLALSLCE